MNEQTVAADSPPAPKKTSRWEDYIDVYFSPTELFQRRGHDRIAPPFLTLLGLAILFYLLLLPANAMIMRASVATNPQAAQMMAGRMGTIMTVIGAVGQPIMYGIITLFTAILLWIVGRFADVRIDFSRAMLIAVYGGFIFLLAQVAALVLIMVMGEDNIDMVRSMSFGAVRFFGDTEMNKFLLALLSRLDLFAIWQAVIWAIGLRVIYKISTKHAALIAGIVWFLMTLPNLLGFLASGMGGGAPPAAG